MHTNLIRQFLLTILLITAAPLFPQKETTVFNQRTVEIPYQVQDKEGSRIKETELWFTLDRGTTWRLYGTDEDNRSPIHFKAPSDGVFGFYTVAVDEQGNREKSPVRGTDPQYEILIDTVPPELDLIKPDQKKVFWKSGTKQTILWKAADSNLADKPVSIEFSIDGGRSWDIVVSTHENTGRYLWNIPKVRTETGLLRIVCIDRADNYSTAVTSKPFCLYLKPPLVQKGVPGRAEMKILVKKYKLATVFRIRGDARKAIRMYREVLSLYPEYVDALNDIALAYIDIENLEKAERFLVKAGNLVPEDTEILMNIARLYKKRNKDNKAYEILTRVLTLESKNEEALWELSLIYEERKNTEKARMLWKKIVNTSVAYSKRRLMAQDKLLLYSNIRELK